MVAANLFWNRPRPAVPGFRMMMRNKCRLLRLIYSPTCARTNPSAFFIFLAIKSGIPRLIVSLLKEGTNTTSAFCVMFYDVGMKRNSFVSITIYTHTHTHVLWLLLPFYGMSSPRTTQFSFLLLSFRFQLWFFLNTTYFSSSFHCLSSSLSSSPSRSWKFSKDSSWAYLFKYVKLYSRYCL